MPVKIRLSRTGGKKKASYRVVVADSRVPRDGRYLDMLGRYDPRQEPSLVEIDTDKAKDWLAKGAQPTEPVTKLLEIAGVLKARPVKVKKPKVKPPKEETVAEQKVEEVAEPEAEAEAPAEEKAEAQTEAVAPEAGTEETAKSDEVETPAEEPAAKAESIEETDEIIAADDAEEKS